MVGPEKQSACRNADFVSQVFVLHRLREIAGELDEPSAAFSKESSCHTGSGCQTKCWPSRNQVLNMSRLLSFAEDLPIPGHQSSPQFTLVGKTG